MLQAWRLPSLVGKAELSGKVTTNKSLVLREIRAAHKWRRIIDCVLKQRQLVLIAWYNLYRESCRESLNPVLREPYGHSE